MQRGQQYEKNSELISASSVVELRTAAAAERAQQFEVGRIG
jgi:hypothetical protein